MDRPLLYIALDLGSNTMAACYDDMEEPGLKVVPMQEYHKEITTEAPGNSPLLPTQISLKEPPPFKDPALPQMHATITFIDKKGLLDGDEEKKSVFRYFHRKLDA